jgi:hypothetical protein
VVKQQPKTKISVYSAYSVVKQQPKTKISVYSAYSVVKNSVSSVVKTGIVADASLICLPVLPSPPDLSASSATYAHRRSARCAGQRWRKVRRRSALIAKQTCPKRRSAVVMAAAALIPAILPFALNASTSAHGLGTSLSPPFLSMA